MSIPNRLTKFLKKHKVYYQVMVHPERFSSTETAESEHVAGGKFAKVVMAKVDERDMMLILPSDHTVDLFKLTTALGTMDARIEKEKDFKDLFPDCEVGAMPPVGRIYQLLCCVDRSLEQSPEIYFNAGTHTESIKVGTQDFLRVLKARVYDFAVPAKKKAEKLP